MRKDIIKKYKLLIFDLDGTLIDSSQAIGETMQKTAIDLKLPPPSEQEIRASLGLPLEKMLDRLFSKIKQESFAEHFYKNYASFSDKVYLFEDVLPTLKYLHQKGYLLTIVTNKIRSELLLTLTQLKIKQFFHGLYCGDDGFTKPHPQVLLSLLEKLSVDAADAVMIGDSKYDMLTAREARVDAIAVCYGAASKAALSQYQPIAYLNHFIDLQAIF